MRVNKSELVARIAHKAKLPRHDVDSMLDSFIRTVQQSVKRGEKVSIPGFGGWSQTQKRTRTARNPRTGAAVKIPAARSVKFTVGETFKEAVAAKQSSASKVAPARRSSVVAAFSDGFSHRLGVLLNRHGERLNKLDRDAARILGERGADAAVAPLVWDAAVGERWSTTTVTEFLDVTRQALHKRLANGTVLGIPGQGTTWFPVWQFDIENQQIRPVIRELLTVFRDRIGSSEPFLVASWATSQQPELGMSPEEWVVGGKDPAELIGVARRAAAELGV